ncbi:MAG TPA: cupin domain-containing protein [Candidatus Tectomicrobia bacterium]|nr:cupin domain-containing protein [Candidatus Tectomicrobia bacterium]
MSAEGPMSAEPGTHGQEHSEGLALYALQALPAGEVAAVEARLAACADCRRELETLRPVVDSFVDWPAAVLRPSTSLWERLARRIAAETGAEPLVPAPRPSPQPGWEEVAPGISCRLLATDPERNVVTMLVRLAPGAEYPPHIHAGIEELHMLEGELVVNDRTLQPGDYIRSEAGTEDHRVWSRTGCTGVLITSPKDVLL